MSLEALAALESAAMAFRRQLTAVTEDDWAASTPCPGWDVHYLVAHVVGGNQFTSMVLDGQTAEQAMDAVMSVTQLSNEPTADFDVTVAAQHAGFSRQGALEQVVRHPLGDLSGQQVLGLRVFDIAVHSWDLAVALGANAALEEPLAEYVLTIMEGEVPGMGFGIQPLEMVGSDAAPMDRLLDLAGRSSQPR